MPHRLTSLTTIFRPQRHLLLFLFLWSPLAALCTDGTGAAVPPQSGAAVAGIPDTLAPQLREKLAEAHAKFNRYTAEFGSTTNIPPGATQAEAIEYQSLLRRLTQTYQTHLNDAATYETNRQRLKDFEQSVKTWAGFAEQPPYSILRVDETRDTIQSLEKKIEMLETAHAFMNRLGSDTSTFMETSEGKVRHLSEQLERLTEQPLLIRISWQKELEQARCQAAAATLASFDTISRKTNVELEENRLRLAFARRQLTLLNRDVCFTQQDLDKALSPLNEARRRAKADELSAYARLEASQQVLATARTNLVQALQATTRAVTDPAAIRHLQEIVETRNAQAQANTEAVACQRQLQRGIDMENQLWQTRFAILQKHDPVEIQAAAKKLEKLYDLILSAKPFYVQQIEVITSLITEQQASRVNNGKDYDPVLSQQRLEAYQQQAQSYRQVLEALEKHEHMISCWREALEGSQKIQPLGQRIRGFFAILRTLASSAWNFELFVVQDTITVEGQQLTGRRGITVGKILLAVLILVVGYGISKRIARGLERLSIRRLRVDPNQANLIRRWSHVIFVAVLVVFSMVSVKIPLTIFAFAGGALAIGIGFGTQNLLKNFISGIIILFERPFRVGDVLDVAGQRGKVTGIGIRSSVIQLWDGTETLIPNSALLENNLTNWTYSNKVVRFTVSVGVAYGSDTRHVAQLLGEVAERHGQVQKEPKPQVLFSNFGDSNLSFDLLYWVDVLKHNSSQVASDLRHMIAGTFAEHGIVMAFPQRDLHLDTAQPLRVQIQPAAENYAPEGAPSR
ncbi:MAG TPA: mechanosensitive ion channel [Kiritimatiellia bacterium]|nr:mechanosensitive ion channel [Kiritimatiellia bacterium]HPS06489.1 mechanosensitive ion channel [Kiritimatiellia bacterium]